MLWNSSMKYLKGLKKERAKMKKHLILTLEYDMGDVSDIEEDGYEIPTDPSDVGLNELFFQGDILIRDMKIVGAKIKDN